MKIQYCSDLHLEFAENHAFINRQPLIPEAEVLLLAGDIVPFRMMHRYMAFFDFLSSHFKTVYWLPGNHEYYGADAAHRSGRFLESVRENVFLLNNQEIILEGVQLIFSSLWSAISPIHQWGIQQRMADFRLIEY